MRDESIDNTVVTLHLQKGWSIRRISRDLGLSRNRVRRILASNSVLRDTTQGDKVHVKKKRVSKLAPYKEYITDIPIRIYLLSMKWDMTG